MGMRSTLYPNANISRAGTVSTNNGTRTPVTKANDGDAVVFCVKNCSSGSFGGNWMGTFSIALTAEAARLTSVGPGTGDNTTSHVINGTTYWISLQITNASYGGGTTINSDCPIFQDWFIVEVNAAATTAKVEEIVQTLGISTSSDSGGSGTVNIGNGTNFPYNVVDIAVGVADRAKTVVKGWVGVANQSKLFWGGKKKYIIIYEGNSALSSSFPNSPSGTNVVNPYYTNWHTTGSSQYISIDHISSIWRTNTIIYMASGSGGDVTLYDGEEYFQMGQPYGTQVAIFIPINRLPNPTAVAVDFSSELTGNLTVGLCGIDAVTTGLASYYWGEQDNLIYQNKKSTGKTYEGETIYRSEIEFSSVPYADYVYIWLSGNVRYADIFKIEIASSGGV